MAKQLVPIQSSKVQVCRYNNELRLNGRGEFVMPLARQFEDQTNRLETYPPSAGAGTCPTIPEIYTVTYSNSHQSVIVVDPGGCHGVSNGVLDGNPTADWRALLFAATAKS